jgi:iron complex outermembrane receptor protein
MKVTICLLILLAALFICGKTVKADPATGSIAGVLKDPSGAIVPGAEIQVRNIDTGLQRSATANEEGRYRIDALPPGRYQVTAGFAGFETSLRERIAVAAGSESTVDFSLRLAKSASAVWVTADAPAAGADVIVPARARTSDTASLLDGIAGLDLYYSGGISSLPVIHGMADDRVNVLVNGMPLGSACSNHMNPPTSYIDPANVGAIGVLAGITPVSRGGDSIGGTIAVDSPAPEFAPHGQDVEVHGGLAASHRTNGAVNGDSAWVSAATESVRLVYTGSYAHASDYKDGAGAMVRSTSYESQNHALQLAVHRGGNLVTLDVGYQHIPQQAFVNARMDMTGNQAKFANLRYAGLFGQVKVDARVSYQDIRHEMNILADKTPGMNMPMDTRGVNLGYSVGIEIPVSVRDTLRVGTEFHRFTLNDWWPPVMSMVGTMGPNTLVNVNNGARNRFGNYVEWETRRGRGWTEVLGVRGDVVRMNAGNVTGYNTAATTTGSAAYAADAAAFNARRHRRMDGNFELTAQARYEFAAGGTLEFGYARKTRSPNIYERYLWVKRSAMSAQMNGWFGDANGYTGNLDLRAEVAHTASATAGWHDRAKKGWEAKVTPYVTFVQDYIDVDRCPVIADGSNGCTAAKFSATSGFVTLEFANHAARLFGVDSSFRVPLGDSAKAGGLALTGLLGYVRGRNLDTGGNLYHMMPLHGNLSLEHHRGNWTSALEFQAVDAKTDVEAVRIELPTAGYALLHLRSGYQWRLADRAALRLDGGADNLTGRKYALPLGGRYWVGDKSGSSPVPGMGRSFYTGLTFQF